MSYSADIFDRARKMVAQCPHPTTVQEQLSRLARRKKRKREKMPAPLPRGRKYWWEDFE